MDYILVLKGVLSKMKRHIFIIRIKLGMKNEYKRRHDQIWPELSIQMTRCGIRNYSIWFFENLCFAYYETDDEGVKPETKEESELSKRWDDYMQDIIEIVKDKETGNVLPLECMFLHE
jgi:L-rhamnose mutarotase